MNDPRYGTLYCFLRDNATLSVVIATDLVSMSKSELLEYKTVLHISSCVAGIAVLLETHKSDR